MKGVDWFLVVLYVCAIVLTWKMLDLVFLLGRLEGCTAAFGK